MSHLHSVSLHVKLFRGWSFPILYIIAHEVVCIVMNWSHVQVFFSCHTLRIPTLE